MFCLYLCLCSKTGTSIYACPLLQAFEVILGSVRFPGCLCSASWRELISSPFLENTDLNYELLIQAERRFGSLTYPLQINIMGCVFSAMIPSIPPSHTLIGRAVCKASLPLCVFCQGWEGNRHACCLFPKLSCAWTMTLVLPFSICQAISDILESLSVSCRYLRLTFCLPLISEFIVLVFDNWDFAVCVCDQI